MRVDGSFANGIGSCQVQWTFGDGKVSSEFVFQVKNPISLDKMRLALVIGSPHSSPIAWAPPSARVRKDYGPMWKLMIFRPVGLPLKQSLTILTTGYSGNVHYIQYLARDHALIMRPGQQYKLVVSYQPDVAFADE